ncbi:MAG: ornithine--oxo-acid transaminase [Gammaproteobacteria bacterium RIFCSPHIGHO2_12_FULL_41_20]|nr:MAG: ornithine--oxo-acid transaminase [Gammaproteobacteria bacterium RIFCSPHIGHO2_12_FULL_41_20]
MTLSPMELEHQFGAQNYAPLPVVLKRAEGVFVWDEAGKRYFDMMSAYSAVSHGHCHPKLVDALCSQAHQLAVVSRAFYSDKLGVFLKRACEVAGQDRALPMNSGAEAVETALKAARKWAYTQKKVPTDQAEIIACAGNFHGRTITIVGMSSEPQYRSGFGPFPAGFTVIPYGDAAALEKAITNRTAAFLVEPIQGEGGIVLPPVGYLRECAAICKKHNVLLICDEIQTGMGRTGKFLACEHEAVKPDAVLLGKALGGGLLPVSLFLSCQEVMSVFTPGDHGSTFGGNPLAAAVGLVALNTLFDEGLITRAAELGEYFLKKLQAIRSPLIKAVRGKGLLIGLEVGMEYSARLLCMHLLEAGVLTKETHDTVLRIAPPLVITKEQIDEVSMIIAQVLWANEKALI